MSTVIEPRQEFVENKKISKNYSRKESVYWPSEMARQDAILSVFLPNGPKFGFYMMTDAKIVNSIENVSKNGHK